MSTQVPVLPEIRQFLDDYRDLFNALDGKGIAQRYAVPSAIVDERKFTYWDQYQAIEDNMLALCNVYADNGYLQADYTLRHYIQQGADFAVVDVLWVIARRQGLPAWEFGTGYSLQRQQGQWKIVLCTAYSEKLPGGS